MLFNYFTIRFQLFRDVDTMEKYTSSICKVHYVYLHYIKGSLCISMINNVYNNYRMMIVYFRIYGKLFSNLIFYLFIIIINKHESNQYYRVIE